jgi:hypothetical protein
MNLCVKHQEIFKKFGTVTVPENGELRPFCTVMKCNNRARSQNSIYCEKHYARLNRTGRLDLVPKKRMGTYINSAGYIDIVDPEHPLSTKDGRVKQHRAVAYEKYNGVCTNCFWCMETLTWDVAHVDHINEDKSDNRSENLVIACSECNTQRSHMLRFLRKLHIVHGDIAIKQMFDESPTLNELVLGDFDIMYWRDAYQIRYGHSFASSDFICEEC